MTDTGAGLISGRAGSHGGSPDSNPGGELQGRVGRLAEKRVPTREEGGGRAQSVPLLPLRHLDARDHAEKRAPDGQCSTSKLQDEKLLWAMAKGIRVQEKIRALKEDIDRSTGIPAALLRRINDILNTVYDLSFDVEATRREVHKEIRTQRREGKEKLKNDVAQAIVQEKDPSLVGIEPNYPLARKMTARDTRDQEISLMRFYFTPGEGLEKVPVMDTDLKKIEEILERLQVRYTISAKTTRDRDN